MTKEELEKRVEILTAQVSELDRTLRQERVERVQLEYEMLKRLYPYLAMDNDLMKAQLQEYEKQKESEVVGEDGA